MKKTWCYRIKNIALQLPGYPSSEMLAVKPDAEPEVKIQQAKMNSQTLPQRLRIGDSIKSAFYRLESRGAKIANQIRSLVIDTPILTFSWSVQRITHVFAQMQANSVYCGSIVLSDLLAISGFT